MSTVTAPSGEKRPTSGSTDTPTRDKRLKTIACDRCRRRKVKCDGDGYNQIPCKYCVSVKLDCTYGKTGRASGANNTSKSNRQTSRNPTRSKPSSTPVSSVDNTMIIPDTTSTVSTSRQRRASSHVISHQNIKQNAKRPSNSSTRIVPQGLPSLDTKTSDYEYALKLFTSMTLQNESQVRQKLKHYIQIPQFEESSTILRQQTGNNTLLEDTHLTGHLVDLYFKYFHPLLPVLHKDYFMETFHNKNKSMSLLLLCAVCAIGSIYDNVPSTRKDVNNPCTVGLPFYEIAKEMVYHSFDLPRLSTAVALFLLGNFDSQRSLQSRIYIGMCTTLAVTMRIHENSSPETFSVNKREARKRLWWGITINNSLQCTAFNRMLILTLHDNQCNIEYPTENCDDETERKIIEYFKNYLMITKIIYDVLDFSLNESYESDMMNSLEESLNKWKRELPSHLRIDNMKGIDANFKETTIEHLQIYLCFLYNYAIIRIHHPNIKSPSSLDTCIRAANVITSFVNEHLVNMVKSVPFILHCVLNAGYIHIFNLEQQPSKDSKRNVATIIKFLQSILKDPSLHYNHGGIKNSIAMFASQLEGTSDEDYVMEIVRSALTSISGNSNEKSMINPVEESISIDEQKNINNNSVSDIVQDNSPLSSEFKKLGPIQQSTQNSQPGISLLAQTAATRSPHYNSSVSHGSAGQQQQSIFTTTLAPLDPPVTSSKIDSSLISDVNYSSTNYQTRQHDNTTSTWHYNQWSAQQSSQLHPIQTQSHQNTMSPTGNETQTMMVINNSPVTTSPPLRTISMTSSSLPPLLTAHTIPPSPMHFSYQTALPSMSYFSASQHQQPQHSSQPYLTSTSTPSTIGISGNFVAGNDISTGLAPMTGMIGTSASVTNGMISTSENSVSMLIDNQGSSTSELDTQQHHQQQHHNHQRRTSQAYYY